MQKVSPQEIRNIAIVAQGGAGKSSLIQSLLLDTREITESDPEKPVIRTEPEEISHHISITPHVAHFDWEGTSVNLIDTPGYFSFLESTRGVLPGVDAAVLVVSGTDGVKPESERLWKMVKDSALPVLAFINHVDVEGTDYLSTLEQLRSRLHANAQPLSIPVRIGANELGIVDLIQLKAWTMKDGKSNEVEIPSQLVSEIKSLRTQLIEKVIEHDDSLVERYLVGEELPLSVLVKALKEAVAGHEFIPVMCGSAILNAGVVPLIQAIVQYLPSAVDRDMHRPFVGTRAGEGTPEQSRHCDGAQPFSAMVLKTTIDQFSGKLSVVRVVSGEIRHNQHVLNSSQGTKQRSGHVYLLQGSQLTQVEMLSAGQIGAIAKLQETHTGETLCDVDNPVVFPAVKYSDAPVMFAIEAEDPKSEEKVSSGLARLVEEDPTLHIHRDAQTHEMILSGMGQPHIDIALERLTRKYGGKAKLKTPRVPYRETLKRAVKVQGKVKKQTGGHGQFANCLVEVMPLPRNTGFEFVDKIVGGAIPKQYIPSVKKGVEDALLKGPLGGFPITDLRVVLYDGSFHDVDSSDYAFQTAGSIALRTAFEEGHSQLLEPIMIVDVLVPTKFTGEIIKDLSSRRGRIVTMNTRDELQEIEAEVPMAELLDYGNILSALTSGEGSYSMSVSQYREVPGEIQERLYGNASAQSASV